MAEKFREHLDKVQDTIQEALDVLPDLSNPDEISEDKLLVPMFTTEDTCNGSSKVQMSLSPIKSLNGISNSRKANLGAASSLSEDERTFAIDNLDNIMCKLIDDSADFIDKHDEMEDSKKQPEPFST